MHRHTKADTKRFPGSPGQLQRQVFFPEAMSIQQRFRNSKSIWPIWLSSVIWLTVNKERIPEIVCLDVNKLSLSKSDRNLMEFNTGKVLHLGWNNPKQAGSQLGRKQLFAVPRGTAVLGGRLNRRQQHASCKGSQLHTLWAALAKAELADQRKWFFPFTGPCGTTSEEFCPVWGLSVPHRG